MTFRRSGALLNRDLCTTQYPSIIRLEHKMQSSRASGSHFLELHRSSEKKSLLPPTCPPSPPLNLDPSQHTQRSLVLVQSLQIPRFGHLEIIAMRIMTKKSIETSIVSLLFCEHEQLSCILLSKNDAHTTLQIYITKRKHALCCTFGTIPFNTTRRMTSALTSSKMTSLDTTGKMT